MSFKAGQPLVLVILDGWGSDAKTEGNAIKCANTPNMDRFLATYPHTILLSSGGDVGLPGGQMGNSEVGHLNIGAGRIIYQELTRISKSIKDRDFFDNEELIGAVEHAKNNNTSLHLMGLLSDGGVHSHMEHLFALLELAARRGLQRVYVHCFLDGRDVSPVSALEYIKELRQKFHNLGVGRVATVMGRYYAMDRDRRWDRTEMAYRAMTLGEGHRVNTALEAVEEAYRQGESDEFVKPRVIVDACGNPVARISHGDAVIFFNFRPDRARQITRAFVDQDFNGFERPGDRLNLHYVCMTQYDRLIKAPVAFKPMSIVNTLGEVVSRHGLAQLRLAETEKYAHVTFFFNGGVEAPNPGEDRILIDSPRVATYDLKPEMSAFEVTDALLEQLAANKHQVIIINYANADMVGHTGDMEATCKAVGAVDTCLGRVVEAVLDKGGTLLITADHGNAEHMMDEEGQPYTAHTTDPVPFILISNDVQGVNLRPGRLEDIAPTMLELLGLPQPPEMTGQTLISY